VLKGRSPLAAVIINIRSSTISTTLMEAGLGRRDAWGGGASCLPVLWVPTAWHHAGVHLLGFNKNGWSDTWRTVQHIQDAGWGRDVVEPFLPLRCATPQNPPPPSFAFSPDRMSPALIGVTRLQPGPPSSQTVILQSTAISWGTPTLFIF